MGLITFNIENNYITCDTTYLISDNTDYKAKAVFDKEWDGNAYITWLFVYEDKTFKQYICSKTDTISIPKINGTPYIYVGCVAGDQRTTNHVALRVIQSVTELADEERPEIDSDAYDELMDILDEHDGRLDALESTVTDKYTKAQTDTLLNGKVDKVTGKGLSTNDYTTADKSKVDAIPSNPKYTDTVYDDTQVKADLSDLSDTVDTKVGYSEVVNNQLKMYRDSSKTVLLATLDLPTQGNVKINGTETTDNNIPVMSTTTLGVAKVDTSRGTNINTTNNSIIISPAMSTQVDVRNDTSKSAPKFMPIVPALLDYSVKMAMCDGIGADWTASEQLAARQRMGLEKKFELIDTITFDGTTSTLTLTSEPNGTPYNFDCFAFIIEFTEEPLAQSLSVNFYDSESKNVGYAYISSSTATVKKVFRYMSIPVYGIRREFYNSITNYGSGANYSNAIQSNSSGDFSLNANPVAKMVIVRANSAPVGSTLKIYGVRA